jgi:proton-translocating NADH-quinone oxidoreductase, chain N
MNAIILSALCGVVMMFSSIFTQNKNVIKNIATIALLVLLVGNIYNNYAVLNVDVKGILQFTTFGLYFNTLAFIATLVYFLLSGDEIVKTGNYPAEYFALIFFSLCGVSILSSFDNLLMLFLGIEILSIPLYILTGADKKNLKSNEAALKYLLMGSFSTGILLMGIALLYGHAGNFSLAPYAGNTNAVTNFTDFGIIDPLGLLFIFIALLFKTSSAPFHFWTPDVYDGAPTVFTSFMATIVKVAGFMAFIILFEKRLTELGPTTKILIPAVIIATLLIGNITAVFQQSVKRMMAYSSIAQAGFMLFILYGSYEKSSSGTLIYSLTPYSFEGILIYTIAYSFATIGVFAIITKMEDYTLEGFNGLAKKHPVLAATNTVFLLSLSGIPLTAGFFAKYYMLWSALKAGGHSAIWLTIVAVLFAAVSVYYYFRVIQAMYFKEGEAATIEQPKQSFKIGLIILAALIVLLGLFPSLVLNGFYF